jgi:hypothetical protein
MSTQLAVRLSDEQIDLLDWYVVRISADSRAEAMRAALEAVTAMIKRHEIETAYVSGYRESPETDEELADAMRSTIESIEDEPWEKWW